MYALSDASHVLPTLIYFCLLHGRFLMYEHMANGSLKEHLHGMLLASSKIFSILAHFIVPPSLSLSLMHARALTFHPLKLPYLLFVYSGRTPLSWRTRMQIAIDVANALVIYRIMLIFLAGWFH